MTSKQKGRVLTVALILAACLSLSAGAWAGFGPAQGGSGGSGGGSAPVTLQVAYNGGQSITTTGPLGPVKIVNVAGSDGLLVTNNSSASGVADGIDVVGDGTPPSVLLTTYGVSGTTNRATHSGRAARGSFAAPAAVQNGDVLVSLSGLGYGATGFASSSRGRFEVIAAETWTDSAQGTYLQAQLTPTGTTTPQAVTYLTNGLASFANGSSGFVLKSYGTVDTLSAPVNSEWIQLGTLGGAGTDFEITTGHTGTGSARSLYIDNFEPIVLRSNGAGWTIDQSGNFLANADNAWDIGQSGANRPRNVYIGGKLTVAGAIDPTSVRLSSGTALYYESANGNTAAVSNANEGRIRYNSTGQVWELSANGGAYTTIATGSTVTTLAPLTGTSATAGTNALAVGVSSNATGTGSVAVGKSATDGGRAGVIAIGLSAAASTTADNSVLIGTQATVSASQEVVIGYQAAGSGANSIVIGKGASDAGFTNSVAICDLAAATASNQFVAGSSASVMTDIYFGKGVTSAAATAYTIHGTGGSGADNAGADIGIAGGISTGAGTCGNFFVSIAPASGSSSTPNTPQRVGLFSITAQASAASTGLMGLGTTSASQLNADGWSTNSTVMTLRTSGTAANDNSALELVHSSVIPNSSPLSNVGSIVCLVNGSEMAHINFVADPAGNTDALIATLATTGHGGSRQNNFCFGPATQVGSANTSTSPYLTTTSTGGFGWTDSSTTGIPQSSANLQTAWIAEGNGISALFNPRTPSSSAEIRAYGTRDSSNGGAAGTNTEYVRLYDNSNVFTLDTEKTGTGTLRSLALATGGTAALSIDTSQLLTIVNTVKSYAGFTTAALGLDPTIANGRITAQSGASATVIAAFTPDASNDRSLEISPEITVTGTAVGLSMTVTYTNDNNQSTTQTMAFLNPAGSFVTVLTTAQAYEGAVIHIRAKANTTVTVSTAQTSGTYNAECNVRVIK